jgi:NTE family protein
VAAPTLREWLTEAPFALTLSSGFFGFFAHAGFVSVLEDVGVRPRRVSGSSAGALVGGLWAAGVDSVRLRDELARLRRDHFWDPGWGFGLLRGALFRALLDDVLAVQRFEETTVPVRVSTFDVRSRKTVVQGAGLLSPAIQASCSVPGLFHPVWIDGRPLLDGGILDPCGLAGMPTTERVLYHHLSFADRVRLRPVAARQELRAVWVRGLPRLSPFRLGGAMAAFQSAARALRSALHSPVSPLISASAQ